MSSFDFTAVLRMVFILVHLLAFAAAFVGVAFGDYAIFSRRRVQTKMLAKAAKGVSVALAVLWVSGLSVIWLDTRFDLSVLAAAPKLLAKLTVVIILTLNGLALHHFAFPRMGCKYADSMQAALLPAVLGAFSLVSWLFAAFLGVSKALAPALGYSGFISLYVAALCLGVLVAVVHVRPRLAAKMALSNSQTPRVTQSYDENLAMVS